MILSLLGLSALAAPALVVSSEGCPGAAAIEAQLRSAGNEMMGHVISDASVLVAGGVLEVEAWGADGSLLGRKSLPAPESCSHRAALIASLLETWSLSLTSVAVVPLDGFVPVEVAASQAVASSAARPARKVLETPVHDPPHLARAAIPWVALTAGAAFFAGAIAMEKKSNVPTGDVIPFALYVSGVLFTMGAVISLTAQ